MAENRYKYRIVGHVKPNDWADFFTKENGLDPLEREILNTLIYGRE